MSGIELKDITDWMNKLDRKVYELDQYMFSSTGGGSNKFKTIIIDDGTGPPVTIDLHPPGPTGLNAEWFALFDNIYIEVTWDSVVGKTYTVEWSEKLGPGMYQVISSAAGLGGNYYRIEHLEPHKDYGVRLYSTAPGTNIISDATAWFDVEVGGDATIPAAPTNVTMTAGFHSVIFEWDQNTEVDVARGKGQYRMQIFSNSARTVLVNEKVTSSNVDSFDALPTGTQYWGRVYAIDSSGNPSPPTDVGPVTTTKLITVDYTPTSVDWTVLADLAVTAGKIADGAVNDPAIFTDLVVGRAAIALLAVGTAQIDNLAVTGAKIQNATIDDAKIANLSAAKVTFGVMSGDRIQANTADIAILKSSSLTTVTITLAGGTLRALSSGGGVGMAINSQGLSMYDTGGTRTIFLDASNGSGSFAGTVTATDGTLGDLTIVGTLTGGAIIGTTITGGIVRTSAGGPRVVLDSAASNFIDFYAIGDEPIPSRVFVDAVAGQNRIFIRSAVPTGYSYAQMYLISKAGDSNALLEAKYIALRAPGPVPSDLIDLTATNVSLGGNLNLWDHLLRIRGASDDNHRIMYAFSEGTPVNGTQTVDGPIIHGNWGVGIGGNPVWGLGFRVYADGSSFRNDSYNLLYCLGGLSTSGSKTFEINHPVRGDDYYLTFSSIEGPRADLMYRGVAKLDQQGQAEIDLDKYYGITQGTFEALNFKENRQAMVWRSEGGNPTPSWELVKNQLNITGQPGDEVAWMVITERGDASMKDMINTDKQGHVLNERKKTEFEATSDSKHRNPKGSAKPLRRPQWRDQQTPRKSRTRNSRKVSSALT